MPPRTRTPFFSATVRQPLPACLLPAATSSPYFADMLLILFGCRRARQKQAADHLFLLFDVAAIISLSFRY